MDGQSPPGKELIVTRQSFPSRTLPQRPDLEQLKRQAKELLESFRKGESAEVNGQFHGADPQTFALHDAQLVIARAYGFESWPKLKAFVDGATVGRLVDAVRAGNTDDVRAMLKVRSELARMSIDNLQVLHHAVLARAPEIVCILMAHGANARDGVYPHRDATTAHAIALQRGYDDIVRIIEEEEQRQRNVKSGLPNAPAADEVFRAIASGDTDRAIALMAENPLRIHTRHIPSEASPLHSAAQALDAALVSWLLGHGADPRARTGQSTAGATHLIKVAVEAALGKRAHVEVFGTDYATPDGTGVRDYIHVSDLAAAHVAALERLIAEPDENLVLNCGYGRGLSVLEVLDAVDRLTNRPIKRVLEGRRAGDPPNLISANRRILETLDWHPQYQAIDRIVGDALAWERKLVERGA